MKRLNGRWSAAGAILAWLTLAAMPANAQFTPSFRGPPMMPMMSPIGPRDPGFHTQPGNISNIPMGGATDTGTTSSGKTGNNSRKSTKRVVSKGSSPPSKITTQTITTGAGRSGAPPAGETRLASDEVIAEMLGNPTAQAVEALTRRYQLTLLDRLALACDQFDSSTPAHFRQTLGRFGRARARRQSQHQCAAQLSLELCRTGAGCRNACTIAERGPRYVRD